MPLMNGGQCADSDIITAIEELLKEEKPAAAAAEKKAEAKEESKADGSKSESVGSAGAAAAKA
jgi:hypothetical protein